MKDKVLIKIIAMGVSGILFIIAVGIVGSQFVDPAVECKCKCISK